MPLKPIVLITKNKTKMEDQKSYVKTKKKPELVGSSDNSHLKTWVKPISFTMLTSENQAQVIGELIDIRKKLHLFNNFQVIKTKRSPVQLEGEIDRLLTKLDSALESIKRSIKGNGVY